MTLVTGIYKNPDDTPAAGTISFTLVPAAMDTDGAQRTTGPVVATLDPAGELSVELVPDPELIVDGEALYNIVERLVGLTRKWSLLLDVASGELDLPSRYPGDVIAPGAVVPVPGPPGPPGAGGMDQATADARYVNVSGDAMAGNLLLDAPSGTARSVLFRTGTTPRWEFGKAGNPETGSPANAGSTFAIARYSDAGDWVDNPLEISRSDGVLNAHKSIWLSDPVPTDGNHAASKAYVDSKVPLVLGPATPVPGGTPAGTIIVRTVA